MGKCSGHYCSDGPVPTPPPPSPTPSPSPVEGAVFCPSASDLVIAYGTPQLNNQGWEVHGNGGVATKAAFNLVGGFVEFDIDFSNVKTGVNANIYTISPSTDASGYTGSRYCDGAKTDDNWCLEVDWIESNGNCGGATTLHTKEGPGSNGCTAWGCRASYHYNGRSSFHMRIEYGTDGSWTTIRDGQTIGGGSLSPQPNGWDWSVIKSNYETKGALIYSSEWVGWVPVDDCGKGPGDLDGSHYKVSNLKISGSVVQGPTPRSCGGPSPGPSPTPSPNPAPSAAWQACSTGPCCNPYSSVAQLCPGQIACKECGGGEACQCPTTAKEAMHEALVLI